MNAAGCHELNITALTRLMSLEEVRVRASLAEIPAWTNLVARAVVIQQLTFYWDPHCDSLREQKIQEFFNELQSNTSITTLKLQLFQGELPKRSDPKDSRLILVG